MIVQGKLSERAVCHSEEVSQERRNNHQRLISATVQEQDTDVSNGQSVDK